MHSNISTSTKWGDPNRCNRYVNAINIKAPDLERFFICNNDMVRVLGYRWNHFVPSLYLLHSKLEKFGVAYISGKVVYLADKELVDA